jgi:hypothetical protein
MKLVICQLGLLIHAGRPMSNTTFQLPSACRFQIVQ